MMAFVAPTAPHAESAAAAVVRNVIAAAGDARAAESDARIASRIDGEAVARRLIGNHWDQSAPGERTEFADLVAKVFGRRVTRILAKASDSEVTGEDAVARDETVIRTAITVEGRKHDVQWRLRGTNRSWRLVDVYIDGASAVLARAGQVQQELRANEGRLSAVSAVLRARLENQAE